MFTAIFAAAVVNICPALVDFAQQQLDNQISIEANDRRLYGRLQAATIDARRGFVSAAQHVREVCPAAAIDIRPPRIDVSPRALLLLEYPPCGTPEAKAAKACTQWAVLKPIPR